jgi:hypothetical protein
MAKRFIDTGLFDDEWFHELSHQSKIFWVYFITKCDHAGFLKFNEKLIKFQTGISNIETVMKDFNNRIVRVTEVLLFSPKFLEYQYPGFPNCNFKAGISARELLIKNNIDPNSYQTVTELLPNSYGIGNGISKGNGKGTSKGNTGENLIFPFDTEKFLSVWEVLRNQPKWKKKTSDALQASLKKLSNYSEAVAIQMMENTIAGGWQGLFEIKNNNNESGKKGFTRDGVQEALNRRLNELQQTRG